MMVLTAGARGACSFRGCVFSRHDVDQEIEHIALGEGRRDIRALQRAPLVLLRMYPGAHRQLGDEYIAALRKQYRRLGGDHFHLGVRLHDLLYPSERELVNLVVVIFILEGVDGLLPVCGQDIAVVAVQALGHLGGHGSETTIRGMSVRAVPGGSVLIHLRTRRYICRIAGRLSLLPAPRWLHTARETSDQQRAAGVNPQGGQNGIPLTWPMTEMSYCCCCCCWDGSCLPPAPG